MIVGLHVITGQICQIYAHKSGDLQNFQLVSLSPIAQMPVCNNSVFFLFFFFVTALSAKHPCFLERTAVSLSIKVFRP